MLGPFMLEEHKGGQYVLLKRNPHYWKTGADGAKLPYLDSIRLDIQSNRETELLRYRRGELQFVDKLEPEAFERLSRDARAGALNAGPSLDTEFFWFNQSPAAQLPAYKKRWFQSKAFRRAISAAIEPRRHCPASSIAVMPMRRRAPFHRPTSSGSMPNWSPPRYDPQLAL